jgi:2-polyprenyl-3-methyl-5-hydroxy-6-metoxy-1,4-benzoquinol methylase
MNWLVRAIGFPATLIHGDTLVWDRWRWLKPRLKEHRGNLLDVGCGSGAFTIGAARMGYDPLGLSWDERNQTVAAERAAIAKAHGAHFDVWDVRHLGERADLLSKFDVAICLENIEHILDDYKLMLDIRMCLKPGGVLLLTTPNRQFRAIGPLPDDGELSVVEDGGHLRRGYLESDLRVLCERAGMEVDDISYCSGFLSQKITYLLRIFSGLNRYLGWAIILPLRLLPVLDTALGRLFHWPPYSICLQAHKPSAGSLD